MKDKNSEAVAKRVERSKRFHMLKFVSGYYGFLESIPKRLPCGMTCCVAGEAALMSGEKSGDIPVVAQYFMGLTFDQADWLFMGGWSERKLLETNNRRAARAIRALIKADRRKKGSVPKGYVE